MAAPVRNHAASARSRTQASAASPAARDADALVCPSQGGFDVLTAIEQHRGVMTVPQLAKILSVTSKTVYGLINRGGIPTFTLPGSARLYINPFDCSRVLRLHNRSLSGGRPADEAEPMALSSPARLSILPPRRHAPART